MNTTNIIIAKNRKNQILKFSGIEDWNEILKEFKKCMSRNNHAGVLSRHDFEEPIEPTCVIRRMRELSRSRIKSSDHKDVSDYRKILKS